MATYKTKLIKKEEVAKETMAFYFEKPAELEYIAGQNADWRIVNPVETDAEGNQRTFSFVTTPSDPYIGFATRLRDTAFKRNMRNAQPGLEIEIIDPGGSMILPKDSHRNLVFLSGGIGITPFMSMLKQADQEKSNQKIYLFFSNRTVADTPFFNQLKELAKSNPNLIFIPTMTQEDPNLWNGETGYINKEMLIKHLNTLENTIFYLAGPIGLVNALTKTLTDAGVDELFIKQEDFGEYK